MTTTSSSSARTGLVLMLGSSIAFGTSGSFATSLLRIGWTPAAAVTVRIVLAAVVLTIPAVLLMRGRWSVLLPNLPTVAMYAVFAVAGAQLFFFNAVARLSVGVALLLEYLGTVLVIGWLWLRHGQRPRRLTWIGAGICVAGLVLVLNLLGGAHLNPVGVLWGLGSMVGLAVYYVIAGRASSDLPPLVLTWAGLTLGGLILVVMDLVGVLPFAVRFDAVVLGGWHTSWVVPVLGLSVIAAAIAYVTGIFGARLLGAKVSSFVGLFEVLAAIVFAWLLLGEVPAVVQLLGGFLIVGGVALVRVDELRAPVAPDQHGRRSATADAVPRAVQDPVRATTDTDVTIGRRTLDPDAAATGR